MDYIYYINGKWVSANKASIPFNDAGFLYGDGLFETIRFDNHNLFSVDKHIKRLISGLKVINLNLSISKNELLMLIKNIIVKNNLKSGIIRLMVTRGTLHSLLEETKPNIYISIKPFYDIPKNPVNVIFYSEQKFPIIRFIPGIKSMNYLGNMLAKKECNKDGGFEPVFYNKNDIITECAIRNIFFIKDKTILTPSLDLGILSGVMRETIFDIAKYLDINCIEKHIHKNELDTMDEAFITSTGIGLLPCYWENKKFNFKLTTSLKKELFNRINNTNL
jgi:branched-subunit amino acid aminotransferase/4-amino-4-deoxychorismate lyase